MLGPLEAPISSRHDKFYLTDEMAVFQVCGHHMLCRLFIVNDCPLVSYFVSRSRTVFFASHSAFFPSTPPSSNPCSRYRVGTVMARSSRANPTQIRYTSPV